MKHLAQQTDRATAEEITRGLLPWAKALVRGEPAPRDRRQRRRS